MPSISKVLTGVLDASLKGNWIEVHVQFGTLIQTLPEQLKVGGHQVVIATLQNLLRLIGNLSEQISRSKLNDMADILNDFIVIIEILQPSVSNRGTLAVLANVDIKLHVILNDLESSGFDKVRIADALKQITASMRAAVYGLKSRSSTGGFTNALGALQNIFSLFEILISANGNAQSSKIINNLLQQLSFVLDGLELITTNQKSKSVLRSISINLSLTIKFTSSSGISDEDLLNLIKMTANSLNQVFDLHGISGTAKYVDSTAGSSAQFLQQISILLNNLQISIKNNDLASVQTLIFRLGE